ncbi:MAG TPA: methionine--tRNA ligase [Terriglobia bacterium]|nr:methionine--tRNA ligase [Terriglobia bacterium]
MKKFYLTTPIYYPNARPHVGSAYTTIACDAIARYKRMCGYDVAFLTGTDEHGEKLERAAAAAGMTPPAFVAEKRELFRELWKLLGIDYTHFVYTDQPDHVKSVQRMLVRAREAGYIDKRRYEGRYCIFDEMYISEGSEPVDCPNCGRPAELISEDNYFFRLSAFQDRLLKLYEEHPEFVQPDFRMNEVKSFVKSGLRDISVSRRRIKWGIPWPDDPEQVFYVWYDALTGYLTGIGFAEGENGNAEFQKYWPADLHMIGKDILRFHAVYWPAFLMAAGMDLPTSVFAHGWIYYEQDKMSKSKGNVVYPEPIIKAFEEFGAPGNDALRYYLLRDTPFGLDGSFSYEGLIQRYNSDLANDLGNLVSRTITMIHRYCEGVVPTPSSECGGINLQRGWLKQCCDNFEAFHFTGALEAAWGLTGDANRYLVNEAPWKKFAGVEEGTPKFKTNVDRRDATLYQAADALRMIAVMIHPVFPKSAARIWSQLGCEGSIEDQRFSDLKWGGLKPGTKVGKPEPIFPRLDKEKALAKLRELAEANRERDKPKEATRPVEQETTKAPTPNSQTPAPSEQSPIANHQSSIPKITIDDFAKVDLRAGTILSAEPIPGATKLLKLQVDIGTEVRQVCAGIAEYYKPEEIIGTKIVLVANLQPRKLRGVESNGMVVAASVGEQGKPILATFSEDVPNGTKLK